MTFSEENKGIQKSCQRIVHSHACALQVMVKDSVGNGSKLNSYKERKDRGAPDWILRGTAETGHRDREHSRRLIGSHAAKFGRFRFEYLLLVLSPVGPQVNPSYRRQTVLGGVQKRHFDWGI